MGPTGSALVLVLVAAAVEGRTFKKASLAAYPRAQCNDGTPAAVYVSEGADATKWVVFLEGGFMCYNKASCNSRYADSRGLMSSAGYGETKTLTGGIFNSDAKLNPVFADANIAYVPYCSSDSWTGATEGVAKIGWRFRGREILDAVVAHLKAATGFSAPGGQVIVSGCSAGGRGALYNLDRICGMLPDGVTCRGVHDAGLWVDAPVLHPLSKPSLRETLILGIPEWNSSLLDPAASCSYPASGNASAVAACYFAGASSTLVATPFFMQENLYDAFQGGYDVGHGPPFSDKEAVYMESQRAGIAEALGTLKAGFSAACYAHCVAEDDGFFKIAAGGVTLEQAVREWLVDGVERTSIETCAGIGCSGTCP